MREGERVPRRRAVLAASAALLLAAASLQAKDEYPVRMNVHVRGAEVGGFVTPDVGDSVKDLNKSLDGKKVLQLVPTADEADLVVTIVSRGLQETGRRIYRSSSTRHSYRSTSSKEMVKVVRATLVAGGYKLPMFGVDDLWWGSAAGDLAGKIDKWIKGNYGQLLARRDKKDAAFSSAGVESEDEGEADAGPPAKRSTASAPAKDAEIRPGMTEKDVLDQLGNPTKKVGFGAKSQWQYKNMTIVFEKGKVTDVKF
jgi:hypothetical protein